ncbi:MAG: Na(+)/H(+)-K(+) antiporter [Fusobacteria bacterium]|nr:MAG: Na(+)/H(+)-K(+) antiporter [Fusobacteriota bacterium]KAF0229072.1 MAG: Na(+)/H(+)-K(+) [Fusobacteriota bacterium]
MELILQLAIIIIASKLAGEISRKLGQPPVLGKLIIGIILGSSFLGIVDGNELLTEFSLIGVILLMFMAGLETDVDDFKKAFKSSAFVGFGGIIVPLVTGYAAGKVMNMSDIHAIFLGMLLSATSVSISVQVLKEMKQLNSKKGATILGAAVIDDVVIIVALAFLMSFIGDNVNITRVIIEKFVFFFIAIAVAWKVVPWFIHKFTKLQVTETIISSALIICFTFAYFAEFTGVSAIIGSYIAGIAISLTHFKDKVIEKINPIGYSIFIPVFLTNIGITADFSGIGENIVLVIVFSIIAILTKIIGASIGALLSGFRWISALGIGAAMISRGEVALIMAKIGLDSSILSKDMFAVLIVVVLITTIITPVLMKYLFTLDKKHA